jgi:sporulation protein YlmC with PRC-barrel domain
MRASIVAATICMTIGGVAIAQDAAAPRFINVDPTDMLSSNVVGLDVYDHSKNDIGKIQDLVLDKSKTLKGYVLSVGGFLGMGSHYVTVDPAAVAINYDPSAKRWNATMNATKDQLKAAPEFKYEGQWDAKKS